MTTLTQAQQDYLRDAIADEALIAKLLGYRKLEVPNVFVNASAVLWGIPKDFIPTFEGQTGRGFLPKWRRSWDGAGELIARCQLSVVQRVPGTAIDHVTVSAPFCKPAYAAFLDHPTPDDAIRFAMCKAAIAYLTAESSTTKESK